MVAGARAGGSEAVAGRGVTEARRLFLLRLRWLRWPRVADVVVVVVIPAVVLLVAVAVLGILVVVAVVDLARRLRWRRPAGTVVRCVVVVADTSRVADILLRVRLLVAMQLLLLLLATVHITIIVALLLHGRDIVAAVELLRRRVRRENALPLARAGALLAPAEYAGEQRRLLVAVRELLLVVSPVTALGVLLVVVGAGDRLGALVALLPLALAGEGDLGQDGENEEEATKRSARTRYQSKRE